MRKTRIGESRGSVLWLFMLPYQSTLVLTSLIGLAQDLQEQYCSMMEMRFSNIAFLLISLVIIDARTMEPFSPDESESLPCDKCLGISRKAMEDLNDEKSFDKVHKLSEEACRVFPTILQDQCFKRSGAYMHEASQILQDFFKEDQLCNDTGLCATSESPDDNCLDMDETLDELQDKGSCLACKRAVRDLLARMQGPKMRTKIVEALLDYCEEAEEDEEQCKQTVYKYGPVILNKLEKFKASELCSMMGMCIEEISMKIQASV